MGIIPEKYMSELSRGVRRKWDGQQNGRMNGRMNGWMALSPLLVFLLTYLLSSLASNDFYSTPISAAFLIASVYAILICRGRSLEQRIAVFSEGAGNKNVLLMIWIFILAGSFSETAKETGAIDAAVSLAMHVLPGKMIYAGLFLASCFISMAIGTSVGTIVALVPVGAGIAGEIGCDPAFITAIIIGGAFFGDNLSFISDTTIAATRTQGCSMADKFHANIRIVLPAALIVTVIYIIMGRSIMYTPEPVTLEWFLTIPYILVIILALSGVDVTAVLLTGIAANAVTGFISGTLGWHGLLESIGSGISGMGDLIIVTMLAGGMLELIRINGGIDFIVEGMTRKIKGKRGAEFSIAGLVALADLCTANNTIAIITTGRIAKDITERFGLDPRKTASILDTFSCLIQGIIPYGAQMLMAGGLAGISMISIMKFLYYPAIMGVSATLAIILRYPKKYS